MSSKSFKSGNTVNTKYLNRIPNPESRIPNWSECALQKIWKVLFLHCQQGTKGLSPCGSDLLRKTNLFKPHLSIH